MLLMEQLKGGHSHSPEAQFQMRRHHRLRQIFKHCAEKLAQFQVRSASELSSILVQVI
jgi:hypothetical protein